MKPKWIGSSTGSAMKARPRASAASMAARSESRSPGFAGTRTGTALPSSAIESVSTVRLSRKSAPARVAARQLVGIGGIDADLKARLLQRAD